MCPPTALLPLGLSFTCSPVELFTHLEKMMGGSPLPSNVINNINPYLKDPSELSDGEWYLVRSNETTDVEHGHWKAKGEAYEVFSNSLIIGWRTTLEFYEGLAPDEHKTNWVMLDFSITHKGGSESRKSDDSSSLCRVFLNKERNSEGKKQLTMPTVDATNETTVESPKFDALDNATEDTATKPQGKDDKKIADPALLEAPELNSIEFLPSPDHFALDDVFATGDYLELNDLDMPLSRSSISGSSIMSLSSNELFDPQELLKELEYREVQDNEEYNCTTGPASQKSDDVFLLPAPCSSVASHNSPAADTPRPDASMLEIATAEHWIDVIAPERSMLERATVEHSSDDKAPEASMPVTSTAGHSYKGKAPETSMPGINAAEQAPEASLPATAASGDSSSSSSGSSIRKRSKKKGGSVKKLKVYLCFFMI